MREEEQNTCLYGGALGGPSPDANVDPDGTNAPDDVSAHRNDQKADNLWKNWYRDAWKWHTGASGIHL